MNQVFDREGALRRVGDDVELLAELVELFLDECPGELDGIRAAVAHSDAKGLEHAAHALKGAAGNVGVEGVQSVARELEGMGRSGSIDGAGALVESLRAEVERARPALVAFLREQRAAA